MSGIHLAEDLQWENDSVGNEIRPALVKVPDLSDEECGTLLDDLQTMNLRDERLCAAVPQAHEWAKKTSLRWKDLAGQALIILARREGAGLHDEILAACREAGFTPKFGHTPSLIGTVLRYVESGAGIGVVPESMAEPERSRRWIPVRLTPPRTVPLVLVWKDQREEPPMKAFRELVTEWAKNGRLWKE